MDAVLSMIAANAAVGAVLAVVTAAIGARWRNPGVLHVLWLLVLAKMLVPPAMEWQLLPARVVAPPAAQPAVVMGDLSGPAVADPQAAPVANAPASAAAVEPAASELASFPDSGRRAGWTGPDLRRTALAAIALGAIVVLGLALFRGARFRLLVRNARPASAPLAARADTLARAMGLRRAPRIRLVDARIPPVLWPGPPCEILLPAALADALPAPELDALLAHELGHVRRRDHWTRGLELLAVAAFWWHPVVWWARRNLRAAEESCCDALVLRVLGDGSRSYADALL
ncbi:MAG TPA: M56 family metallopeptidase, partial [bacterium]|nr:M56 family metallopeptidase [bacterium]